MKVLRIGVTRGDVRMIDIPNTLEALQREVGGYIETYRIREISDRRIVGITNEEGLLRGFQPNKNVGYMVGVALWVNTDGEEFTDLTDGQIRNIKKFWRI